MSQNYSEQVRERTRSPKYRLPDNYQASTVNSLQCRAELSDGRTIEFYGSVVSSDGRVAELYHLCSFIDEKIAFIDALVELCQRKTRKQILSLSSREVESFLRDQNHLPAFPSPHANEDLESLFTCITELIMGIEKALYIPTDSDYSVQTDEAKLTLVESIKLAERVLGNIIRPILSLDGGEIELVNIIEDNIYLRISGECSKCRVLKTATIPAIESILRLEMGLNKLKVVAEQS